MIKENYARAYTEVLEMLKYLPYKELNRIPKEKIEFYGEQMTLDAIAKKEGIKRDTLEVHYKKTRYLFSSKI